MKEINLETDGRVQLRKESAKVYNLCEEEGKPSEQWHAKNTYKKLSARQQAAVIAKSLRQRPMWEMKSRTGRQMTGDKTSFAF